MNTSARKRKLREGMEDMEVHGAGIVGDLGIFSRWGRGQGRGWGMSAGKRKLREGLWNMEVHGVTVVGDLSI